MLLDPGYEFTQAYHLRWNEPNETAYPAAFVIDSDEPIRFAKVSDSHGDRASADQLLKALDELESEDS